MVAGSDLVVMDAGKVFLVHPYNLKARGLLEKHWIIIISKGQLISKCLFGIFNSPKKRNKNQLYSKVELFLSVFGRIQDTNKTFQN